MLLNDSSALAQAYDEAAIIALNVKLWPEVRAGHQDLEPEMVSLQHLSIRAREERFLQYWQSGLYPEFMRHLQVVNFDEKGHHLTIWVAPDYLSLGSDRLPILTALSFINAAAIARSCDALLPTRKIVDAIYQAAKRRIWPKYYAPTPDMVGIPRMLEHNRWVQGQKGLNLDPEWLTAGHKKDLVLSQRLVDHVQRLALYGWQDMAMGSPIQPLSIWHHAEYVDYSHGFRLVGAWALLDGHLRRTEDILRDNELSGLLSDEGALNLGSLLHPSAATNW